MTAAEIIALHVEIERLTRANDLLLQINKDKSDEIEQLREQHDLALRVHDAMAAKIKRLREALRHETPVQVPWLD